MTSSSRPAIDRFDHVFFAVADFDKSLAFYNDVLGWNVLTSWGGAGQSRGAVLSGGGIKVVIAEKAGIAPGPHPIVHLDIHDVNLRFKLMGKGEHVVVAPEATHWGTKWFVVRDPDGNEIAFEEHSRGG
jgi:catechol 2,3-dioxygenase-like lactoylglutathione lyase family enzyme